MIRHHLYLAAVWLHILSAVVWIGGAAFIALVLVPALRRPDFRGMAPALLRASAPSAGSASPCSSSPAPRFSSCAAWVRRPGWTVRSSPGASAIPWPSNCPWFP